MFLDVWRRKRIKRNLEEAIKSHSGAMPTSFIKRIGLLIDTTAEVDVELLTGYIEALRQHAQVATICYVERVNTMQFHANSTFDSSAFNWQGEMNNAQVDFFVNQEYDLLISYYASALPILQFVTARASAHFKVGFPARGAYQLNDLTIDTKPENVHVFCTELKNYLRILKRID